MIRSLNKKKFHWNTKNNWIWFNYQNRTFSEEIELLVSTVNKWIIVNSSLNLINYSNFNASPKNTIQKLLAKQAFSINSWKRNSTYVVRFSRIPMEFKWSFEKRILSYSQGYFKSWWKWYEFQTAPSIEHKLKGFFQFENVPTIFDGEFWDDLSVGEFIA